MDNANRCSTCIIGPICVPEGMTAEDARQVDDLVQERTRVKKGQALYTMASPVDALFAVRLGTFKSLVTLQDGRQQITAFHFPGDLLGLDGLADMRHGSEAVALEDSEVCVMRYPAVETLARALPSLQRRINQAMAREIGRDHRLLMSLGSMRAEERLAAMLLDFSRRASERGYSSNEFVLRMSREEIGSHLGLKLETVSRLFSRFAEAGLLKIQQRHVRILDFDGLRALLDGER